MRPILLSLVNHPCIEKLDMSFNNFSKETYHLLTRVLQNNDVIQCLDISMNRSFFDESLELMMGVFASTMLREFRYDFNIFQVEAAVKLNQLNSPNYSLEKLSFSSASFSTKALKEFAQSVSQLKALKSLNLSMNGLTNNDAASLAQLAYNCPSLEEINFSANNTNYFFIETFEQTWKTLVHKRQSRNQKPLIIILSPKAGKVDESIRNAVELLSGSRPVKFI
jgi:Ran GTPase-activating protein (RanGAP) involved in mRNA processing and transport